MNGAGTSESIQQRLCRLSRSTVVQLGGDEAVSAILGKSSSLVNRCYKTTEKHRFTAADVLKLNEYQVSIGEEPEFLAGDARYLGYELRPLNLPECIDDPVDTVLKAAQDASTLTTICIDAAADYKITLDELHKIKAAGIALRGAQRALEALEAQVNSSSFSVVGSAA
ncbi:hypothetical protein PsAD5_00126 [Pseudovibrio sp. Ad5]|nr:hypothetical protein PsAD5_00126 [Pseudovibrio sp. Ad5]